MLIRTINMQQPQENGDITIQGLQVDSNGNLVLPTVTGGNGNDLPEALISPYTSHGTLPDGYYQGTVKMDDPLHDDWRNYLFEHYELGYRDGSGNLYNGFNGYLKYRLFTEEDRMIIEVDLYTPHNSKMGTLNFTSELVQEGEDLGNKVHYHYHHNTIIPKLVGQGDPNTGIADNGFGYFAGTTYYDTVDRKEYMVRGHMSHQWNEIFEDVQGIIEGDYVELKVPPTTLDNLGSISEGKYISYFNEGDYELTSWRAFIKDKFDIPDNFSDNMNVVVYTDMFENGAIHRVDMRITYNISIGEFVYSTDGEQYSEMIFKIPTVVGDVDPNDHPSKNFMLKGTQYLNTTNNKQYVMTENFSGIWEEIKSLGEHESKVASTTELGHIKVDGTTITINNGIISSSGGDSIQHIYQEGVQSYPYTETSGTGTAFGYYTQATGAYSFASGWDSRATGNHSHAVGYGNRASAEYSYASGHSSEATHYVAHAEGMSTKASGYYSHSQNAYTEAVNFSSTAMGIYSNMNPVPNATMDFGADALVLGNGNENARSNAFKVKFDGSVYGLSAYNSSGADYAEYWEWEDGNVDNEDRVGYFVTLNGGKIRKADSGDNYILGVVSGNPSVIGDTASEGWNEKYVRDEFCRIQYHHVDIEYPDFDDEGTPTTVVRNEYRPILNPEFDNSKIYIPREQRKEWSPVGHLGKLLVRDDGSCEVDGYCKVDDGGIATESFNGYRVLERISDNIIKIFIK